MYHGRLYFSIFLVICAAIATVILLRQKNPPPKPITNFEECAAAGYPVMESYPRQCTLPTGGVFVEQVLIKER